MKTRKELEKEIGPIKDCVGCGFCCKKAQCLVSIRIYGPIDLKGGICPALIWDEEKKRYWCKACMIAGELGAKYKAELYIGEGCCCNLNSDRQNIPPPKKPIKTYPKELQVFIKNLGREWINSDVLWLAVSATARELNDPNFEIQALYWLKEQRSGMVQSFMG